jgi:hypothetical protein
MKQALLIVGATLFLANLPMANAEPQIISKTGGEQVYIKRLNPALEGMDQETIDTAKRFGTYESLKTNVTPELGRIWVGTVVTKEDGKCTATTSTPVNIKNEPGEPEMNVTTKVVDCPA